MKLSLDEIVQTTGGKLVINKCNFGKAGLSTDSRTIGSDDIFLPITGKNFDGHDFINNALKRGCIGYFAQEDHYEKIKNLYSPSRVVILVENTLEAYLKIANYSRKKINPKLIAVTGSSGKTTVKEMIFSVLSQKYKTHKSLLNHNNEIGLCQTLMSMPENTEFAVVEAGMRGLGEIELLSKHAEPNAAIITNIGNAHIGMLGSIENIAKAKCEISKHLKKDGVLIAQESELIKKHCKGRFKKVFCAENNYIIQEMGEDYCVFEYEYKTYKLPVSGEYNILNAIFAIEIGKLFGLACNEIQKGLLEYSTVGERGKVLIVGKNIKIISDCYNANPDSMKASIDAAAMSYPNHDIIFVLGDMTELGEYEELFHRAMGEYISDKNYPNVKTVVTVGEKAFLIADAIKNKNIKTFSFSQKDQAAEFLNANLKENSAMLLKASRAMNFEDLLKKIALYDSISSKNP